MRGPDAKVGQPFYLLPQRKKGKKGNTKKQENARRNTTRRHDLETAPLRPLPYKCPVGGGAGLPSSPSPLSSRGGIMTVRNLSFSEGQHRSSCPFATEEQGYSGRPEMLPSAKIAHALSQFLDLGLPGRAVHGSASHPRRTTSTCQMTACEFIAKVVASRCVPWQRAGSGCPRGPCVRASAPFEASAPSVVCSGACF